MARTDLTRLREKGSSDRARLDALLDEVRLGHVAFVSADAGPSVLPILIVRDGDRVLLHGSTGSPWLRHLASGAAVSVAITALDGLVVARSAYESSMHYRSAVLFGTCAQLADERKSIALDVITDALIPGRVGEIRRPNARELAATVVLELPIAEWSLKISDRWPEDDEDDVAGDAWAGIVPLTAQNWALPQAAPDLRGGIATPESVRRLAD